MDFFEVIRHKSRLSKISFLVLGIAETVFMGFICVGCLTSKWYLDSPIVALMAFAFTILIMYGLGDIIRQMITLPDYKRFIKEVEGLGLNSLDDFANQIAQIEKHPAPRFGKLYLSKNFIFYEQFALFGSYVKAVSPASITAISIYTPSAQNKDNNYILIFCGEENSGIPKKKLLRTVARIPVSDKNAVELRNELRTLYAEHLENPECDPLKVLL